MVRVVSVREGGGAEVGEGRGNGNLRSGKEADAT